MMKQRINYIIAILCFAIAILVCAWLGLEAGWFWLLLAVIVGLLHLFLPVKDTKPEKRWEAGDYVAAAMEIPPEGTPTELVLLNENGKRIASWNIYGKNGIVIGRDVGENHVTVNLDETTYASMIDIEHAVMNYSGNDWYVENISSQNGVSIQKRDGRKYWIAYGKPCKVELGDILFIGLTRLQIL